VSGPAAEPPARGLLARPRDASLIPRIAMAIRPYMRGELALPVT